MSDELDCASVYANRKVVVAGGAGFIGAALAERLVEYGAQVTVIDAYRHDCGANDHNLAAVRDRCRVVRSDIAEAEAVRPVLQGVELIFDLAGRVSHVDSMTDPMTDFYDNATAHLAFLELVRSECPTARILYTGTRGQYGATDGQPVNEGQPLAPLDVNGASKTAGEQLMLVYGRAFSQPVTSLRLTNTFGPRHQMRNARHGVLNWFLRQLMEGQTIRLYGGGEQIRDTSYVDDVVDSMCVVMSTPRTVGEIYNVGGEPLSLKQFSELAIEVYGSGSYEVCPFPAESKRIDVGNYISDTSKITAHTGWRARTSVRDGLQRSFAFYQEHREHYW